MTAFARRVGVAGLIGLTHVLLTGIAAGQTPRINYVTPMGGQAGASFELTVTGQDVENAKGVYFSFPGATFELQGSENFNPKVDPKKKKGPPAKQLSQKFKVTLPADAPLGVHDVRLITSNGVSNPRAFVVGDLPEVNEAEPNDDLPKAQKMAVNTTVNGLISVGTDVDYYLFSGKKGQHVVVSCLTTSIDSKLPVEIKLYSMSGASLGYSKGYQHNDAVLDAVLPTDDDYYIRVASFAYTQGGPDYFYRLSVSTAPWIDAVFPSTIEPGKEAKVTVYGRNLPGGVPDPSSVHDGRVLEKTVVTVKAPQTPQDMDKQAFRGFLAPYAATVNGFGFHVKNETGWSNNVLITYARAPVVLEAGTNDSDANAQKVEIPCEIAGRIEKKHNRDWYTFSAKKGQVLTIEAFGERIGSPMDLYYVLRNEKGTVVTEQDENLDITANQFYTRTDDPPRYRLTVPADGDYKLMVSNKFADSQASPRMAYTVRIMPETPGFSLVAMATSLLNPDSVVVNQSSHQVYTVFAFREGGFTGDITLSGENLPAGVTIQPQVISGSQKQANLVVSRRRDAPVFAGGIKVIGTATTGDTKLVRPVRGASITWPVAQAAPTISRLDRELVLGVREKAPYTLTAEIDKATVTQGDKITITVKVKRQADFKQPITIVSLNLPNNLTQQPLVLNATTDTGKITFDYKGGALPADTTLTLALRGQTLAVGAKGQQPKGMEPSNFVQACNPITVTIVPRTKAKTKTKTSRLSLPRHC